MTDKSILKSALGVQRATKTKNKKGFDVLEFEYQNKTYHLSIYRHKDAEWTDYGTNYIANGLYDVTVAANGFFKRKVQTPHPIEALEEMFNIKTKHEESFGVYAYYDDDGIKYIGKDSNIDIKQRHYNHLTRNEQEIDKHVDKLNYMIMQRCKTKDEMNLLESRLIEMFKPMYNKISGIKTWDNNEDVDCPWDEPKSDKTAQKCQVGYEGNKDE